MAGDVHLHGIPRWVWGFLIVIVLFLGTLYLVPEARQTMGQAISRVFSASTAPAPTTTPGIYTCQNTSVLAEPVASVVWGPETPVMENRDGSYTDPDRVDRFPPIDGYRMLTKRARYCEARWMFFWRKK